MKEIIENLNQIIDSGVKIHSIDEGKQTIAIIEGLEITDSLTNVLISNCNFEINQEVSEFTKTAKFQNAIFKPTIRGIILIDIAGYSKGNTLYQAAILTVFNQVIKQFLFAIRLFAKENPIEQIIPTGDGCYIVFNEDLNERFFRSVLAIVSEMHISQILVHDKFHKDSDMTEKLHIRIGCTLNETDFFYDVAGNRNCYGIGMNEAARILSYGQKKAEELFAGVNTYDTVFFDDTVYSQAKPLIDWIKEIKKEIEIVELGEVEDKHKMKRNVWWLKNLPKNLGINLYSVEELKDK